MPKLCSIFNKSICEINEKSLSSHDILRVEVLANGEVVVNSSKIDQYEHRSIQEFPSTEDLELNYIMRESQVIVC
jgi:hypothetical protein